MPDKKTGRVKQYLVQDTGDEVLKVHTEFRRMVRAVAETRDRLCCEAIHESLQVLTGQDLREWLKREPEFHRRLIATCYANRRVLRVRTVHAA